MIQVKLIDSKRIFFVQGTLDKAKEEACHVCMQDDDTAIVSQKEPGKDNVLTAKCIVTKRGNIINLDYGL